MTDYLHPSVISLITLNFHKCAPLNRHCLKQLHEYSELCNISFNLEKIVCFYDKKIILLTVKSEILKPLAYNDSFKRQSITCSVLI